MPATHRAKPIDVDAFQFVAGGDYPQLTDDIEAGRIQVTPHGALIFMFAEGVMEAKDGDWVVRGPDGGLVVVKAEAFADKYEPI